MSGIKTSNLGFPRVGRKRELKFAQEQFWSGKITEQELQATAANLRKEHWTLQQQAGISHIPSNDFSFYDHVLDTIAMVGAVPSRYGFSGDTVALDTFFAMARGSAKSPAMEMTKWFDTNYHYIVPEFEEKTQFRLSSRKAVDEFLEAKELGIHTRPVLLGPVSFVLLGKLESERVSRQQLVEQVLPVYAEVLRQLESAGADWVQIDEPFLGLDLDQETQALYQKAYRALAASKLKILLTTYFSGVESNRDLVLSLPVAGLHLDLVRAPQQLAAFLENLPEKWLLSLGIVDGRNIWRTNLDNALSLIRPAVKKVGAERILLAPSCSLLHTPIDLDLEDQLDPELLNWLAFAKQKLNELNVLAHTVNGEDTSLELEASREAHRQRASSPKTCNPQVRDRLVKVTPDLLQRQSSYPARRKTQEELLNLPLLPTTTIGSLPQTAEVRKARAEAKSGKITSAQYQKFLESQTESAIRFQEELGIDVLVHGEFERNDMVEYFGEQLAGFAFTRFGWVQSYGSRCVKPPIIFGDVSRPHPMTVEWAKFAQSLTKSPMKGMLTGPVTILNWSFVRDDQPRSETCQQIAFAIRDEVQDLERAGIRVIQIDEPALREGLPLRKSEQAAYLQWAVDAFRLTTAGVEDSTQIHTHMCYCDFNDIIDSIARLDADVISLETSRSRMELLDAFVESSYPNEIGPGVYDIHSPRIPATQEMVSLLEKALQVLRPEQIWVNPDCGLKTRRWEEVKPALEEMVSAARQLRAGITEQVRAER